MIGETAFMDCDNLPEEMADSFDKPWNFVGEVKTNLTYLKVHCAKCNPPRKIAPSKLPEPHMVHIVVLLEYPFVTGDMLEVRVYFGICDKCDGVYWARQGPPFKRVSSYIEALA